MPLDADEHGRRAVGVALGVFSGLVLAEPEIELVAGHEGLDPLRQPGERRLSSGRSQLMTSGTRFVRPHREPADRVGLKVFLVLVEVVGAREPRGHRVGAVVEKLVVADEVEKVRVGRAPDQEGRLGRWR